MQVSDLKQGRKATARDCIGCHNNFYNGNNDLGVRRCWSLDAARIVKAMDVPINMRPPYTMPETRRPNCYQAQGYARVKRESLTRDGYWRGF